MDALPAFGSFEDLTPVDPPVPTDWDDEPTLPYGLGTGGLGSTWRVEQDPLRLTRVL